MGKLGRYNKSIAALIAGAICVFLSTRLGMSVEEVSAAQTLITLALVYSIPNSGA